MPLFKLAGSTVYIDGEVSLVAPVLSGEVLITIDSIAELFIPSVLGYLGATVDVTLPILNVRSKMSVFGNCSFSLSEIKVSALVLTAENIAGIVQLPFVSITGNTQAECNVTIPKVCVYSHIHQGSFVNSAINFPCIELFGTLTTPIQINANFILPTPRITITTINTKSVIISCSIVIPALSIYTISLNTVFVYSEEDVILRYSENRRKI